MKRDVTRMHASTCVRMRYIALVIKVRANGGFPTLQVLKIS